VVAVVLAAAMVAALQVPAQPPDVVAELQVHGNLVTADAEIARMAGVEIGMPVTGTTIDEIEARLLATKRFERVQVLKRFASLADPTRVTIVIVVDEGRVHIEMTGDPAHPTRVVRDRGPRLLFLPVLDAEDGYGVTYGVRVTVPQPAGSGSHASMPLSWGGDKRAAIEFDKIFDGSKATRIAAEVSLDRREHPFYERDDDRVRVLARAERSFGRYFRVGGTGSWQHVAFLSARESFVQTGVDAVVDTRLDPLLARNAVYARAAVDRSSLPAGEVARMQLEGRGYIGLFRQNVLVLRALREDADGPLPPYLKPILGGMANLRGFRAGTAVGDRLVAASGELLVPLTSPLSFGKMGIGAFVDAGAAYDYGQRLADQPLRRGAGGSIWFSAAFVRLNVALAHGIGSSTRVHVGGGVSF
jgi:hypothetical protein